MSGFRNQWLHVFQVGDVFHNDALTFEQKRDEIVRRLKAQVWYEQCNAEIPALYDLEHAQDLEGFDESWSDLYDWCDKDKRVWIDTFSNSSEVRRG